MEDERENIPPREPNSQHVFKMPPPRFLPQSPSKNGLLPFSSQFKTNGERQQRIDVFKKHADWCDRDQGNSFNGDYPAAFPIYSINQPAPTEQREAYTKSLPPFPDFLGNPFSNQKGTQMSQQWSQGLDHMIPFQQNTVKERTSIWNDTQNPFLDNSKIPPIPHISHILQQNYQQTHTTVYPTGNADGIRPKKLSIVCECCRIHNPSYELNPCKHLLCNLCAQAQKKEVVNAYQISFKCPLCQTLVLKVDPLLAHSMDLLPARPPKPLNHATRPLSETAHFSNPMVTIGNQILSPATTATSVKLPMPVEWPVVKISNIPWDCSQRDVRNLLGPLQFPSVSIHAQCIHILMDRTNGKTLSEAFVEMGSEIDAIKALERNQKPLKGRMVTISRSSQEELMTKMFPKWKGTFVSLNAIAPSTDAKNSTSLFQGGPAAPPLIAREETSYILVVCRSYKLHFSRKCAERPFEQVISIMTKMPWHQPQMITTMHRDHLFEMLKISIEYLMVHLQKDYSNIDETLLERLVRAGLMVPMFTDRQKNLLLSLSQTHCPPDIQYYLAPPLCLVSSSSIINSENELIVQQLKSLNLMSQPLPQGSNRAVLGELTNNKMEESSLSNTLVRQVQQVARVGSKLNKANPKAIASVHRFGQSKESKQILNKENRDIFHLDKENIDPQVKALSIFSS